MRAIGMVRQRSRVVPRRFAPGTRSGLTLLELMAAMVVLLVGVYAVAALFPKLSGLISEEESRTTVARATQQVADGFRSGVSQPPDATAPHFSAVDLVDPGDTPEDPDTTNTADNPANSRDDFIEVFGERITVPAPAVAGGYPCHVPVMGLIDPSRTPFVYELRELKRAYRDPGVGGVNDGEFYLRSNGALVYNPEGGGCDGAIVYYDWLDGAMVKNANGELVGASGSIVQAVTARGGTVMPSQARAYARYPYGCTFGPPGTIGATSCWVDATAGQSIFFAPQASGKKLRMDYRVRREDRFNDGAARRAILMHEDRHLPTVIPYQLNLAYDSVDDATPIATLDLLGGEMPDIWVMVVDKTDGATWVYDENSGDGTGNIAEVDFERGKLLMQAAVIQGATPQQSRAGHPIRIFYRTMNEDTIQVQKAPSEFVEVESMTAASNAALPNWQHRRYMVGARSDGTDTYTYLFAFPTYLEGQAVEVDYSYDVNGTPVRVANEIHVISDLGDANLGYGFVLSQPTVRGVYRVEGASIRVVGWWRTEQGRISRYDVANMLFPKS